MGMSSMSRSTTSTPRMIRSLYVTPVTQRNGFVSTIGDHFIDYIPDNDYCNDGSPTDDFTYTINGGLSATVAVRSVEVQHRVLHGLVDSGYQFGAVDLLSSEDIGRIDLSFAGGPVPADNFNGAGLASIPRPASRTPS